MDQPTETFHLFGGLRVADPKACLPPDDLAEINQAVSLMRDFAKRPPTTGPHWNISDAHRILVDQELAWWRSKGVERPREYIVRPSGSLEASVACLLNNPTFSVQDPCNGETFDISNATMAQLERAGFNRDNAFFIDQVARRDSSENVEIAYPEDLREIHERFLREAWVHMGAIVVICWGSAVRKRMLGTREKPGWFQNHQLIVLWGRYHGIELYLELSADRKSMTRFVLFVKHPSYFFYIQSDKDCARNLRRKQGRPQDLALEIAAKLGRVQIQPHFYELSSTLRARMAVPGEVTRDRDRWKGEAAAQVQHAFPGVELSGNKSHRIRTQKREETINQIADFMNSFNAGEVCVDGPKNAPVSSDLGSLEAIDKAQRFRRFQKINDFCKALKEIIEVPESSVSRLSPAERLASCLSTLEEMVDIDGWEDLPAGITALIQDQPGLKFDGRPIGSREDLELAYRLLHDFVPERTDPPEVLGITDLAMSVLLAYGMMILRNRRPKMDENLILRDAPYDILSRKCGRCNQIVLDDPFPNWSRANPDTYVSWPHGNCGYISCQSRCTYLKPLRREVKWSRPLTARLDPKSLAEAESRKSQRPMNWLLRNKEEQGSLPDAVEVKCRKCPRTKIVQAKWTIHPDARFLLPQLRCGTSTGKGCCHKGTWVPVGKFQNLRTIDRNNLDRMISKFRKRGFDLTQYPRDGRVIFSDKTYSFRIAELRELKMAQSKGKQC